MVENVDLVMRSVYLKPDEDAALRELAHRLNVSKSDLIRSAISVKLQEWLESGNTKKIHEDLEFGRRENVSARMVGPRAKKTSTVTEVVHKAPSTKKPKKPAVDLIVEPASA